MRFTSTAGIALSLALSLGALSLGACAPAPVGPRPVDVAAVRRAISHEMAHDWTAQGRFHGERQIVSMGHVTQERAVVYTDADGKRFEETWVRGEGGWTLQAVQPV